MTATKAPEQKATRASVRITDDRARKAKVTIWDSVVKGFHVRVTPSGARSFRVRFQRKDGTKVCVTLGPVDAWTVEDPTDESGKPLLDKDGEPRIGARTWAARCRKAHDQGNDPRAELKETRASQDLNAWVKVWRVKHLPKLKAKTQASYESLLKNQILPVLGKRLIRSIGVDDVQAMYDKAVEEGKETSAKRAVAVLSNLMKTAERAKKIAKGSNPCRGFETHTETARKRTLTPQEFAALEAALVALVAASEAHKGDAEVDKIDAEAADLIRFLALSGLRKGEALGLKFSDVDIDQNTMTFEDHKTAGEVGTKVLPLNSHLRAIIQRRALQLGGVYVFPGRWLDSPIVGLAKMWERVVKAAQLVDATPHDLRRTFYTTVVKLAMSFDVADILTGHKLPKIRDTYGIDPHESPVVIQASQDAADWIAAAMAGTKVKPGVKVTQQAEATTA